MALRLNSPAFPLSKETKEPREAKPDSEQKASAKPSMAATRENLNTTFGAPKKQ